MMTGGGEVDVYLTLHCTAYEQVLSLTAESIENPNGTIKGNTHFCICMCKYALATAVGSLRIK